jgi:hypothetical protein
MNIPDDLALAAVASLEAESRHDFNVALGALESDILRVGGLRTDHHHVIVYRAALDPGLVDRSAGVESDEVQLSPPTLTTSAVLGHASPDPTTVPAKPHRRPALDSDASPIVESQQFDLCCLKFSRKTLVASGANPRHQIANEAASDHLGVDRQKPRAVPLGYAHNPTVEVCGLLWQEGAQYLAA